jgi:hypothetical protein
MVICKYFFVYDFMIIYVLQDTAQLRKKDDILKKDVILGFRVQSGLCPEDL